MSSSAEASAAEDIHGDGRWMSMHNRFLAESKDQEPDVLFIGDSIVAHLGLTEMWEKCFAPMHALNFGIGGDTTQNLLWRLDNGELEHIKPKAVVLHIGTNNVKHSAAEVAEGIETVVKLISSKLPEAYIIVTTLLPRGHYPNPLREKNADVNRRLAQILPSINNTQLVNIDPGFVQPDGTISHHDLYDYLHLTRLGYQKAFESVYDLLLQLLFE
ncbi:Platelet-activating factor acetylhydrolase IB subunit gamma [Chamberlinius hualienensis]